jgi:hypothetical protein
MLALVVVEDVPDASQTNCTSEDDASLPFRSSTRLMRQSDDTAVVEANTVLRDMADNLGVVWRVEFSVANPNDI